MKKITLTVTNCLNCHYCGASRANNYGPEQVDYFCHRGYKYIAKAVEYAFQEPKDNVFPAWCPLEDVTDF